MTAIIHVEFDWDPDHLSDEPPVESLPIPISPLIWLRRLSLRWWAKHRAHQHSGGDDTEQPVTGASMIRDLTAAIIRDGKVPSKMRAVSLSASTRVRGMHWKGEITAVSS